MVLSSYNSVHNRNCQYIMIYDYIVKMIKQTCIIFSLLLILTLSYDSTVLSTCIGTCKANCSICSTTVCNKCQVGFQLNSGTNACDKYSCTISGCSGCSADGKTCLNCTDQYSYFDSSTSSCVSKCTLTNCAQCIAGSTMCKTCNSGYTLYTLTNQCTSSLITNCLKMHDFPYTQFQCTLCKTGYKPSTDQTQCIATTCSSIANCQTCSSASTCDKCRAGYSFTGGKCTPNACNVAKCLYCSSNGTCLRCLSNYTLSYNQCVKSPCSLSHCDTCKAGSMYCDICTTGYSLNIWTKNCENTTSSLIFLWLLVIPVAIIAGIIVIKLSKSNKVNKDNDKSMNNNDILQETNKPMEKKQTGFDHVQMVSTQQFTNNTLQHREKALEDYFPQK